MPLSTRLEALFTELVPGFDVWDIGYDHGLLGMHCLGSKKFVIVHFVDPVDSIAKKLKVKLASKNFADLQSRFTVQVCKLEQVPSKITGNLVFAGVGAVTIQKSLQLLCEKDLLQAQRVILSPQRDAEKFEVQMQKRSPFFYSKYSVIKSKNVIENNRKRTIFVYEPRG